MTYIMLQSWHWTKVNKKILIWDFVKELQNNTIILMQGYSSDKYIKFLDITLKTQLQFP